MFFAHYVAKDIDGYDFTIRAVVQADSIDTAAAKMFVGKFSGLSHVKQISDKEYSKFYAKQVARLAKLQDFVANLPSPEGV